MRTLYPRKTIWRSIPPSVMSGKGCPWFLDYYRKLGVRNFVFVDNDSTDGSLEYLRDRSDVTLYATRDSYVGAFGRNGLGQFPQEQIEQIGLVALMRDVDEALVYDGCDTRGLNDLIEVLEGEGAEAMTGYMLDMFSYESAAPTDSGAATNFVARYPYYLPKPV